MQSSGLNPPREFTAMLENSLRDLFVGHGVTEARLRAGWVAFPSRSSRIKAEVSNAYPLPDGLTLQVDFLYETADAGTIIESIAGIGKTPEEAAKNAIEMFAANVLRVLLFAFFQKSADQVQSEPWQIGNAVRDVTIGNLAIRGTMPESTSDPAADCLTTIKKAVATQALGPKEHWLRLYAAQNKKSAGTYEVLLDNNDWDTVRSRISTLTWPPTESFYSIRLFLVISRLRRR